MIDSKNPKYSYELLGEEKEDFLKYHRNYGNFCILKNIDSQFFVKDMFIYEYLNKEDKLYCYKFMEGPKIILEDIVYTAKQILKHGENQRS